MAENMMHRKSLVDETFELVASELAKAGAAKKAAAAAAAAATASGGVPPMLVSPISLTTNPFRKDGDPRPDEQDPQDLTSPESASSTDQQLNLSLSLNDQTSAKIVAPEWDASKVPPSQFQRRKGSIYATPNSRDGQRGKERDQAYFDKLREKGWLNRKGSC